MPIDPRMVAWDEPPTIDEKMVKWDEPKKPKPAWANAIEQGFGGIVDPILRMGTGMISKPISDIAGLGAIPLHAMGMIQTDPRQIQQNIQQGMTFEPRTEAGASPYNPLNAIPNAIGSAIDYIRPNEAQDPASWSGAGQNALREAIPQALSIGLMRGGLFPTESAGKALQSAGKRTMTSALKPTLAAHQSGDAATAAQVMLDKGLNVTPNGAAALESALSDINQQISNRISNSPARVDLGDALRGVPQLRDRFLNQVDPIPDMEAIQGVVNRFSTSPRFTYNRASGVMDMPIQDAQAIKQGTYRVLSGKYGEQGSALTEAQKTLARGLKEGIAQAEPAVAAMNAEESKLISTLGVVERRVLMQMNNNPQGLAALAKNPAAWANMMADKSPLFKSLAARLLNSSGSALEGAQLSPITRFTILSAPQLPKDKPQE